MPHKQRTFLALSFCVLMLPGCQAFKSKFDSLPKLPSPKALAFWKKDTNTLPPPPPSRHLNPVTIDASQDEMLAGSGTKGEVDVDQLRQQIDEKMDDVRRAVDSVASSGKTRSPYSVDETPTGGSSFGQGSGSRFASQDNSTGAGSDSRNRREDFSAAIAGLERSPSSESSSSGFKSARELFSADPSSEVQGAIAKAKSGFSSGFESAADRVAESTSGFKSSFSKVNDSLSSINGSLASASKNVSKAAENTFSTARERFGQTVGSVADGARDVAKSSEQLAGKLKNQFTSATEAATEFGNNSLKSAFTGLKSAQAKVSQAVESKVAEVNSGFNFPKSAPAALSEPSGGGFDRTRVANVTPVGSSGLGSSVAAGSSSRSSASSSRNLGSGSKNSGSLSPMSPQQNPPLPAQLAGASSSNSGAGSGLPTGSQSSSVYKNAQSIPSAFGSGENRPASHVSDVDLPSKLLRGSSSYAPGSVHLVR